MEGTIAEFYPRTWVFGNVYELHIVIRTVVKKILGLILVLASASAMAQSLDAEKIIEGYRTLRSYPTTYLRLDMTTLYGQRKTQSSMDLTWSWDPTGQDTNVYLGANEYVNGVGTFETVADGSTLSNYNFATGYRTNQGYGGMLEPGGGRSAMLGQMYGLTGQLATYAVHFLQDAFGGADATYSPWSTGALYYLNLDYGSVQDPLTDEVYAPSPTQDYIAYETPGVVARTVVFERKLIQGPDGKMEWTISAIHSTKLDNRNPNFPVGYTITMRIGSDTQVHDPSEFRIQSGPRAQSYDTTD